MTLLRSLLIGALLTLTLASSAWAQWDPSQGLILEGKVLTQDADRTIIPDGRVYLRGDKIVAVCSSSEAAPEGFAEAKVIDTQGLILPGLIDSHNHVAFNFLPLWDAPEAYPNRGRWMNKPTYKALATAERALTEPRYFGMRAETVKYGEIRALVGGTTSIQGTPTAKKGYASMLVRNIDYGLEIDDIMQRMANVNHARFIRENRRGENITRYLNAGEVSAWLVHLSEGVDERSRKEFDILEDLGLVRDECVFIHGTALTAKEFKKMGAVDADLVWSPLSNRLLYGATTDVRAAIAAGVNVSLAPDWALSGSKNLLGELKVADSLDNKEWDDVLTYEALVDMVTVNPARALKWDDRLGRVKAGYYADLLVLDDRGDPYGSVVHGVERNVKLVFVSGDPLYGDDELMTELKGDDCELICQYGGRKKLIDVTNPDEEEKGEQTLDEITDAIDKALEFDPEHMRGEFRDTGDMTPEEFAAYFADEFPELKPITRPHLYAEGDDAWFDQVRDSQNGDFADYDLRDYWENPDRVVGETASAPEEPTVAEPTVSEPTVSEPTVSEPTVAEPTVAEPTVAEPTVEEPTVEEPGAPEGIAGVVSIGNGRRASLYDVARGSVRRVRLSDGAAVTELDRSRITPWSEWVRVRTVLDDGTVVEGWMSARYFEPAASVGLAGSLE